MTETIELTATEETISLFQEFQEKEKQLIGGIIASAQRRVEKGIVDGWSIGIGGSGDNMVVPMPLSRGKSYNVGTTMFYPVLEEKFGRLTGLTRCADSEATVIEMAFGKTVTVAEIARSLKEGEIEGVVRATFPFRGNGLPLVLIVTKQPDSSEVWQITREKARGKN